MSRTSKLCPTLIEAYLQRRAKKIAPVRALEGAKKELVRRMHRRLTPLPIPIPRPIESFDVMYKDRSITVTWNYVDQEYAFEGVGKIETLVRPYGAIRGGEEIVLGSTRGYARKSVLLLEYTWLDYFNDLRKTHGVAYAQREADEYITRMTRWARDVADGQIMDQELRVECADVDFFEYSEAFERGETAEARDWLEDTLRYLLLRINNTSS